MNENKTVEHLAEEQFPNADTAGYTGQDLRYIRQCNNFQHFRREGFIAALNASREELARLKEENIDLTEHGDDLHKINNEYALANHELSETIAELQAENAALKEAQRWVPVDSNVKHMENYWIYHKEGFVTDVTLLDWGDKKTWCHYEIEYNFEDATHYMPYYKPTPPTTPNTCNAR